MNVSRRAPLIPPRRRKFPAAKRARTFASRGSDEKKLYVIDTGFTDGPNNPSHIRVFDADVEGGKVSNGKVFAEMPKPSITDGMRADTAGNIWCSPPPQQHDLKDQHRRAGHHPR